MSSSPHVPPYEPSQIEPKWQLLWEQADLFQNTPSRQTAAVTTDPSKKRFHLFAFAYPSGSGLHVGHVESKTALDMLTRFRRMNGDRVYFPVGWDAFGLPAENYAIKTGIPPAKTTHDAIDTFRRQIKRLGISYDWANEIATNHPEYYRWTQWLFLQLYNKGLAYKGLGMVNWCPSCQTVLANEQVVEGQCERCGTDVTQKELTQWYFKITQYQEELIRGLETVDWPKPTKQQQLNWIGKSEGINITYQVVDSTETLTCFTTTPVNFGATFIVIAPEHRLISQLTKPEQKAEVEKYLKYVGQRSELERTINKEKTGVFTGSSVINHVTGQPIPVYVADFVLAHVGTGVVQGCPGHDERDFEFAQKFGIPIARVVVGEDGDTSPITRKEQLVVKGMAGKMINSDFLNGLEFKTAMQRTMDHFEQKGWGQRVVTYRLRDWLISRQRYWGAPIPIVYDPEGQPHPVKEEHLPWLLPEDVDFKPTGESPLKSSAEFIARTEKLYGKGWRPEFDTMDTFVDSSWYYLRYCDARNDQVFADPARLKAWLPVDLYLIGPEHIVLHLLYSRFFTKFLRDEGYLSFDEPFQKMRHQGMILGPDGKKMSKSKGNVINPDEIIQEHGADTLRVYEMFMGPLEADKPWNTRAVAGVYRFLKRLHRAVVAGLQADLAVIPVAQPSALTRKFHQTLQKVTQDLPELKFNTAVAAMMEFLNLWETEVEAGIQLTRAELSQVIRMVAPFAPFLAEELWSHYRQSETQTSELTEFVHQATWPVFDPALAEAEACTIMVQVNGKIRGQFQVAPTTVSDAEAIKQQARALPELQKWLGETEGGVEVKIKKVIYVPGKLVSFVV